MVFLQGFTRTNSVRELVQKITTILEKFVKSFYSRIFYKQNVHVTH